MSLRNQIPTGPNPYTDGFSTSGTSNQGTPIVFQDPIPLNSGIPHLFDGNASSLPTAGTLDEPVLITIKRDLVAIYRKLSIVFHPATVLSSYESPDGVTSHSLALNDWDLWGPLFLCLILAISLSFMAPPSEAANIFTLIFFLVWFGSGVITINAKLLGGQVCFFQSVCILGYCLAPQAIAAVISCLFITWKPIKLTYLSGAFVWSITASLRFLEMVPRLSEKRGLAIYPVALFYFVMTWIIFIS